MRLFRLFIIYITRIVHKQQIYLIFFTVLYFGNRYNNCSDRSNYSDPALTSRATNNHNALKTRAIVILPFLV